MTDVIFKGSASRPTMSVAEGTIVFDNSAQTLEGRGDEIAVTRRVYKSGEGEYLIDGARVRLKDVREMLFGTGLGSRGYSVLEQGKIDAVLSQNPVERRRIFEEAAGVSRYRQRKHEAELRAFVTACEAAGQLAFDTETTDIDYMRASLVGLCMAFEPGEGVYVPVGHDYVGAPDQLAWERVKALVEPLLANGTIPKIGQNLKYDISVLARHGVTVAGPLHDTMLESYVLNSVATRHNMDDLAKTYLGRETIH